MNKIPPAMNSTQSSLPSPIAGEGKGEGFRALIAQKTMIPIIGIFLIAAPKVGIAASASSVSSSSSPSSVSSAFNTASDRCSSAIEDALTREVRLYRTVLFGHTGALAAKPGSTRYDSEGNPWMKVEVNAWRTSADGFGETTWTDLQMDAQEERDPFAETSVRRGIFETRTALTSELLPSVLQSFRALRCRAAAVCANASRTFERNGMEETETYDLQPLGCIAFEDLRPLFPCQLGLERDRDGNWANLGDWGYLLGYCEQMTTQLLNREAAFLKLTVSYDAAYRSLLQFAGHFDQFLRSFRSSLLLPIRQAVTLLGNLHRIPCFLSQCDE